jgi:hypothetical protein
MAHRWHLVEAPAQKGGFMNAIRCIVSVCAFLVLASCGLPPSYEPQSSERFQTIVDVEHWLKDDAPGWSPIRNIATYSQAALLTYRLGQDAKLPHAWWATDNCLVTEGTWRDTDFTPPSYGAATIDGTKDGAHEFEAARTHFGYGGSKDDWGGGSNLKVKTAGDTLPAFEFSATVAPEIKLTTWDMASVKSDQIKIPRDRALDLTWTPGSGNVLVLFIQYNGLPDIDFIHTVWCSLPAESGTGTIPYDVIRTIHQQAKVYMSHLYFGSLVRDRFTSANSDVDLFVWNGRGASIVWEN